MEKDIIQETKEKAKVDTESPEAEQYKAQLHKLSSEYMKLQDEVRKIDEMHESQEKSEGEDQTESERKNEIMEQIRETKLNFVPTIDSLMSTVGYEEGKKVLDEFVKEAGMEKIEWSGIFEQLDRMKNVNDVSSFEDLEQKENAYLLATIYNEYVSHLDEEGPKRLASPYESIVSSVELKEIGKEVADILKDDSVAVLQGGSASWGAYHSTRGQVKENPFGSETTPMREEKLVSDVDLMVIYESPEDVVNMVQNLVNEEMLDEKELERAKKFVELYNEGEADFFSTRGHSNQCEQSYHFIGTPTFETITDRQPEEDPTEVPVLKDFRPDVSGSLYKYGGYPILGLEGEEVTHLAKDPEELPRVENEEGEFLGYINESPLGGPIKVGAGEDEDMTWTWGLLTTQLAYQPDIHHVSDSEYLNSQFEKFQESIAPFVQGKDLDSLQFPRSERMTEEKINEIREWIANKEENESS